MFNFIKTTIIVIALTIGFGNVAKAEDSKPEVSIISATTAYLSTTLFNGDKLVEAKQGLYKVGNGIYNAATDSFVLGKEAKAKIIDEVTDGETLKNLQAAFADELDDAVKNGKRAWIQVGNNLVNLKTGGIEVGASRVAQYSDEIVGRMTFMTLQHGSKLIPVIGWTAGAAIEAVAYYNEAGIVYYLVNDVDYNKAYESSVDYAIDSYEELVKWYNS